MHASCEGGMSSNFRPAKSLQHCQLLTTASTSTQVTVLAWRYVKDGHRKLITCFHGVIWRGIKVKETHFLTLSCNDSTVVSTVCIFTICNALQCHLI